MANELSEKAGRLMTIVDGYLEEYALDDGEIYHEPSELESLLIHDAVHGLIDETPFLDALTDWWTAVKAARASELNKESD